MISSLSLSKMLFPSEATYYYPYFYQKYGLQHSDQECPTGLSFLLTASSGLPSLQPQILLHPTNQSQKLRTKWSHQQPYFIAPTSFKDFLSL